MLPSPRLALVALAVLLGSPASPAAPASPAVPARPAARRPHGPAKLATRALRCHAERACRCTPAGCEAVTEGLPAEQFEVDAGARNVGACLYTDCYSGPARVVRDRDHREVVTAFGEVRSARPIDGTTPPGSAPFPLSVTVNLRTGRFTAVWGFSPEGLQTDFGRCELE